MLKYKDTNKNSNNRSNQNAHYIIFEKKTLQIIFYKIANTLF